MEDAVAEEDGSEADTAEGEGEQEAEYDPCSEKNVGACSLCDPADEDCFETAQVKFCTADGVCNGDEADVVCENWLYPRGPVAPNPFWTCEDGSMPGLACIEDGEQGMCVWAIGLCSAIEDPCQLMECAPGTTCIKGMHSRFETRAKERVRGVPQQLSSRLARPAIEEFCNADGMCTPTVPICRNRQPCEQVVCAPGFACDEVSGDCIKIDKDPCEGKSCGDTCSTCPPGVPCPTVVEFCNADGACTPALPKCDDGERGAVRLPVLWFRMQRETGACEWMPW